eukprot:s774_g8.t1
MEANRTMYPGELSPGTSWHRSRLSDATWTTWHQEMANLRNHRDFSLSPNSRTTMRSTGGFSLASNRTMGGRIQSAPLLHSTAAPSVASWDCDFLMKFFDAFSSRCEGRTVEWFTGRREPPFKELQPFDSNLSWKDSDLVMWDRSQNS